MHLSLHQLGKLVRSSAILIGNLSSRESWLKAKKEGLISQTRAYITASASRPHSAAPTVQSPEPISIEQDKWPIFSQLESAASHSCSLSASSLFFRPPAAGGKGHVVPLSPSGPKSSPFHQILDRHFPRPWMGIHSLLSGCSLICLFRHSSAFGLAWSTPKDNSTQSAITSYK